MSLLIDVPVKYNGYNKSVILASGPNSSHSFFINKNGKAQGWGSNVNTRIGDNTSINRFTSVVIALYGLNKTFCKIAAGGAFSVAIDKNGRAWGWGNAFAGRIGDNTTTQKCYPVLVAGATKTFCQISSGNNHTIVIDKNGRAWGWGYNTQGQLGDNSITSRLTPVSVLGAVKTFCQISGGGFHSLAIDKNGRAWGWGYNGNGRIGDNSTTQKNSPVSVLGAVKTFCKISAGVGHSGAIDKNGRVWCWGRNGQGQLGDNSITSRLTPVSILGAAKTFCKISMGGDFSLAIDKNGRAWGWGYNGQGRLGDNSTTSRLTPVSVAGAVKTFCEIVAGAFFGLALEKNGSVWGWGDNINGLIGAATISKNTPVSVLGAAKTFCKIAIGGNTHIMIIDKNGRAWGWGYNGSGRLGDNSTTSRLTPVSVAGAVKTFCEIAEAQQYTLAIDKNGRAWGWGNNSSGQLGNNSITSQLTPVSVLGAVKTFCKIAAGADNSLAIDKNGRAWSWGTNTNGQLGNNSTVSQRTPVSVLGAVKTFCQISGGSSYSLAIDKNGRAWGWGLNNQGRIGDNSLTQRLTPVSVAGAAKTFCQIGAGSQGSVAIDKNGRLWTWGVGITGQLADGTVVSIYTPITISGATKTFCQISSGDAFSLAIDKNGRAWGWGYNNHGQIGDNSITQKNSPVSVLGAVKTFCKIAAGGAASANSFSLAIDKNGRVWGWGNNGVGQLGNNAIVSQRTPVSILGATKTFCEISNGVNQAFALAIDKNGRVWSWGVNGNGQLGNNSSLSQRTPVSVLGTVKTFCKVSVGGFHSLAIDKNGRLWAWGNNSNGQLGNNQVANSIFTPVSVLGAIKTFCHIAGGNSQSVAIDKNGQAWGWGFNGSGQTGDGSATDRLTPVSVAGQKKTFCKIASGNGVTLSIDNYGRLWAWGFNGNAQIGDSSTIPKRTPTRVANDRTFCEVRGANTHVLAIEKNGQVWGWGTNTSGQLANKYSSCQLTPVSVVGAIKTFCKIATGNISSFHIALDKNGKIWGWGRNNSGQLGINKTIDYIRTPTPLYGNKTFCALSVNTETGYGIDYKGKSWGWGSNSSNQLGTNNYFASAITPVRVCNI
jgi:alpha-tubulin suppressor-like RCC1 family protein